MPLMTGNWNINANGSHGVLNIIGVDSQGRLNATVYGDQVVGWWDEEDRRITFLRQRDGQAIQSFSGYTWDEAAAHHIHYLAGSFETYAGGGGTAARPTYGWFASLAV